MLLSSLMMLEIVDLNSMFEMLISSNNMHGLSLVYWAGIAATATIGGVDILPFLLLAYCLGFMLHSS